MGGYIQGVVAAAGQRPRLRGCAVGQSLRRATQSFRLGSGIRELQKGRMTGRTAVTEPSLREFSKEKWPSETKDSFAKSL